MIETIREPGEGHGIVVATRPPGNYAEIGDGSEYGVKITFIKQPSPDGLAHAVKISQEFIGDDRFVMFLGDNCIQGGISSLIRDFADSAWNSQIVLKAVADPQMYGVADLNDDGSIAN